MSNLESQSRAPDGRQRFAATRCNLQIVFTYAARFTAHQPDTAAFESVLASRDTIHGTLARAGFVESIALVGLGRGLPVLARPSRSCRRHNNCPLAAPAYVSLPGRSNSRAGTRAVGRKRRGFQRQIDEQSLNLPEQRMPRSMTDIIFLPHRHRHHGQLIAA
jgi:hypothetical protein